MVALTSVLSVPSEATSTQTEGMISEILPVCITNQIERGEAVLFSAGIDVDAVAFDDTRVNRADGVKQFGEGLGFPVVGFVYALNHVAKLRRELRVSRAEIVITDIIRDRLIAAVENKHQGYDQIFLLIG